MLTKGLKIKLDPLWCSWFLLSAKPHFLPDTHFKVLQHFSLKYWSILCLLVGDSFWSILHCIKFIVHCSQKAEIVGEKNQLYAIHYKEKSSMIMQKQFNSDCFTVQAWYKLYFSCAIWNTWTALKHKPQLPEEHAVIFKSL